MANYHDHVFIISIRPLFSFKMSRLVSYYATNLLDDSYFMFPLQFRWLTGRKESRDNNVTDKQDPPFVQVNVIINHNSLIMHD